MTISRDLHHSRWWADKKQGKLWSLRGLVNFATSQTTPQLQKAGVVSWSRPECFFRLSNPTQSWSKRRGLTWWASV